MPEQNETPTTPRPWWAALLTSALTTLFGLALIVISVVLVRPALAPDESWVWLLILSAGAGMAGVGGSLISKPPTPPPDQRGTVRLGLLIAAIALVPLAILLGGCGSPPRPRLVPLAILLGGCGAVQVRAEREITWERRPGSTCYVRTLADGEVATESTAPTPCVPPPEFCQPGPGEPGFKPSPEE